MNLESCTAANNAWGIYSYGAIRAGRSMLTANNVGVQNDGTGTTISFGDNHLSGNTTDGTFTSTVTPQ
jgi:hypothetical protein